MAVGEYVSVSTQRDTEQALLAKEADELATDPEAELHELAGIYRSRDSRRTWRSRWPSSSPPTTRSRPMPRSSSSWFPGNSPARGRPPRHQRSRSPWVRWSPLLAILLLATDRRFPGRSCWRRSLWP